MLILSQPSGGFAPPSINQTLPNLLIIGAMKAGTTALHQYLAQHPEIYMSRPKELRFFVKELNWDKGLSWYKQHFANAGSARILGESSTHYSMASRYSGVPARIAAWIPSVQLLYLVRHPVRRMQSAYLHRLANGQERRPIEQAFAVDEPYFNDSRYAWQLQQYLPHFDRKQILVVQAEKLRDDRTATLRRILQFLNVDDDPSLCGALDEKHRTASKVQLRAGLIEFGAKASLIRRMLPTALKRRLARMGASPLNVNRADLSAEFERSLEARFVPEVAQLREYMTDDFDGWQIA